MKAPRIGNAKILIVDDHIVVRADLEKDLRALGAKTVDHAEDVAHAMERLEKTVYDIVFVDLKMPGKNGYVLMQAARKDKRHDNTAFIVISAESEEHYVIEALAVGAQSYIVKPLTDENVRDHTERALKWIHQRAG